MKKLGGNAEPSTTEFGKVSPDGRNFAFVRANNLFVQNLVTLEIRQLTHDGSHTIINGTSDWVYEEEFDLRDGFRWSPDSQHLAFWHFDSNGVGEYPLVNYTNTLYLTFERFLIRKREPRIPLSQSALSISPVTS